MSTSSRTLSLCVLLLIAFFGHACNAILSNAYVGSSLCDVSPCKCPGGRGKVTCDCSTSTTKEVLLTGKGVGKVLPNFSSITVRNCSRVYVTSRALESLPALRQLTLSDIDRLTLEEQAFSWPHYDELRAHSGITIDISNASIAEIPSYAFRGAIQTLVLQDANVTSIKAYAFSSLAHMDKIELTGCNFSSIEPQAFKKFSMNYFIVSGSTFPTLSTRTMVDIEVHHEMRLQNVKFDRVKHSAFRIHGPQFFRLFDSHAARLDTTAFHVNTRGSVSIHDNVFSSLGTAAFAEFNVERRYLHESGKQEISFENNTITHFDASPLVFNTSGFDPRVYKVILLQACTCPLTDQWLSELILYSPEPNVRSTPPGVASIINCQNAGKPITVQNFRKLYCGSKTSSLYVIVALAVGTLVTLSIVGLIVFIGYRKTAKRYLNEPTSRVKKLAGTGKTHMMVVPEGRTYRETELHVIIEHAEPITPTEYVGPTSELIK